MSRTCATVTKILPFSCVDGPGNRLVFFLQGCNYRCLNCHNPYTIGSCDHCGECVTACPHDALHLQQGKVFWQSARCQQCDSCLRSCPRSANPMTQRLSVAQLLEQVRRYLPFINGITLSGGEATLQLPLLTELLSSIRQAPDLRHLSCFIDSNGSLSATGWQRLLPLFDGAMIDLKAWDNQCHRQLTGQDNSRVLESLRLLAQVQKLYEVRLLLIPGQSDHQQHLDALADFLLTLGAKPRLRLNAFHSHGVRGPASQWPSASRQQMMAFAAALQERGLCQIDLPAVYL